MKKIKPEQVYIVVFTFFAVSAAARYIGEYVQAAVAEPSAADAYTHRGR